MGKILFVDDDIKYQNIIKDLLELEGYNVDCVNDPAQAVDLFKKNNYELIITDLIMDTIDGLQLVSIIKRINPHIPIIVLTGHTDYLREVEGLDLNVSDYIYKPVSMEVLLRRINRQIRTKKIKKELEEVSSKKDDIYLDLKGRRAYQNNQEIALTAKEFDLLAFLLGNKNEVYSREEMIEKIWNTAKELVDYRTVDTHIKKIRSKIRTSSIRSIRGVGYEWFE